MSPEEKIAQDFRLFIRNAFTEYTLHPYQEFLIQKVKEILIEPESGRHNLLLSMPPGTAKSWLLADCLIPYLLGIYPDWQICICSYAAGIANTLGKRARQVMEKPFYTKIFPESKIITDGKSGSFEVAGGGSLYCVGRGGQLTSKRFHVILLDDGIKNQQEALSEKVQEMLPGFLFSTLLTRFHRMEPKTLFMAAETVWSENVSIKMLADKNPAWPYFNLSAIATEGGDILGRQIGESLCEAILPLAELLEIEKNSPDTFGALYQGNPVNAKATYFKSANLKASYDIPALSKLERPVTLISLDTASQTTESADFTVATHWAAYKDYWIVTKIDKLKIDITGLLNYVNQQKADYLICEQASSGLQLLQLRQEVLPSKVFKNMRDKESYAKAFNELLGAKIFIKQTEVTLDIENEILSFPFGKHDDSVLSLLHGYRFLLTNQLTLKSKTAHSRTAGGLMRRANSW